MTHAARTPSVHVIIPALNEERSLPPLLTKLEPLAVNTIVVDNGSLDRTGEIARQNGATVVTEPSRGYGSACLAGIREIQSAPASDIVIFLDADGSDDPTILPNLINVLTDDRGDLVLASRTMLPPEAGALSFAQRFGNWLACAIIARLWRVRYTDLAPCRALRMGKLRQLEMDDKNFGWTVQMQIRAAKAGFRIVEVPHQYRRRRFDESKISGRIGAGLRAGVIIMSVIGREKFGWRGRTDRRADLTD